MFLSVECYGVEVVVEEISELVVLLFLMSVVMMDGFDDFDQLFELFLKCSVVEGDFKMYIDWIYLVMGVGVVVLGMVNFGVVEVGDEFFLGLMLDGEFCEVEVCFIEMYYYWVDWVNVGCIVGIVFKGVCEFEIECGMVFFLVDVEFMLVCEFEVDVIVFNYLMWIQEGYELVVYFEIIFEVVVFYFDGG